MDSEGIDGKPLKMIVTKDMFPDEKWMPYKEYLKWKDFESEALRREFIKQGLGWLVKFLDDAKEGSDNAGNNGSNDKQHQSPQAERNSRLNIFKDKEGDNKKT